MAEVLWNTRPGKTIMKKETARERVESFIERRRADAGEFVSGSPTVDGYLEVRFERVTFFTSPEDKAVYQDGISYRRPPLKGINLP
jgi:hypothetical protein